jgi:hypothetical protein
MTDVRRPVRWLSPREACDLCHIDISDKPFVDGKLVGGPWALMCEACHRQFGIGLGTGRGQRYDRDGVKIGG